VRNSRPAPYLSRCRSSTAIADGANGIVKRLLAISEVVGFRAVAYGLGRHSFATAALVAGVPDAMVAGLLGHTGTVMLSRHYSHVTSNARAMQDAARRARGSAGYRLLCV
jgi:site-specific recombinase XerD